MISLPRRELNGRSAGATAGAFEDGEIVRDGAAADFARRGESGCFKAAPLLLNAFDPKTALYHMSS